MLNKIYYRLRPFIPREYQILLRSRLAFIKRNRCCNIWPIFESAGMMPIHWRGWPEQKKFALVLTHDVETTKGHGNCSALLEIEKELGFRSSFNFVPERYYVDPDLRDYVKEQGCEVGVHGLNHDGKLFSNRKTFSERAVKINRYLSEWNAVGFRAPSMHHKLGWIHELNIKYDLSTFDIDPFEPQSDGVFTIFPFWVDGNDIRMEVL